jgi:hypothetical protein
MPKRASKHLIIRHSHSVIHKNPLYYEKPKESSLNIKKMPLTGKIAFFIFYFKNIFRIGNLNPSPGGNQWKA